MVTIRTATLDDLDDLVRLNQDAHRIHVDHEPSIFGDPGPSKMRRTFRALMENPNNRFFLAIDDGDPVGYVMVVRKDIPENPFVLGRRVVDLDQIAVRQEHRRSGVGRQLVEAAREYALESGTRGVELTVWNFNDDARLFFEQCGFRPLYTKMQLDL